MGSYLCIPADFGDITQAINRCLMDILDALLLGENTLVQHREVGLNVFDTGFVLIVEIHLFLLCRNEYGRTAFTNASSLSIMPHLPLA
jgi:hypothetical protein